MSRDRAVALVVHEDKLLVIKRNNKGRHYFTLPGGGIEDGETREQATLRELEEEASLKLKLIRQVYEHNYDNGQNQYVFLCEYQSGEPKLADDSIEKLVESEGNFYEPMWLPVEDLPDTLLLPLGVRDWLIEDLRKGFPEQIRVAKLNIQDLEHTFEESTNHSE